MEPNAAAVADGAAPCSAGAAPANAAASVQAAAMEVRGSLRMEADALHIEKHGASEASQLANERKKATTAKRSKKGTLQMLRVTVVDREK